MVLFVGKCRYQTGALAPVIRWLSQGMQRAAAPPQAPRGAVRADNLPAAGAQQNDNAGLAGKFFQTRIFLTRAVSTWSGLYGFMSCDSDA